MPIDPKDKKPRVFSYAPPAKEQHPAGSMSYEEAAATAPGRPESTTYEEAMGLPPAEPKRTFGGTIKDVGISAAKGVIGLGQAAVGAANLATGGLAGKGMDKLGYDPEKTNEMLGEHYSDAQKAANQKLGEAEGFVDSAKAMIEYPSTIGHAIVESAPLMFGGGAIARTGIGALKKFAPKLAEKAGMATAAGAAGEGAVAGGFLAESIRQETENKELTGKQALMAVGGGIGTGIFGLVGGRLAERLGLVDVDTLLAGGASAAIRKEGVAGIAKKIVGGGISEGLFEELPQESQETMWQNAAFDRPLFEGVPEAAAQGLIVGAAMGMGVNVIPDRQRNKIRTALADGMYDPGERAKAANAVWHEINQKSPELASNWHLAAQDAITNRKPINLEGYQTMAENWKRKQEEAAKAAEPGTIAKISGEEAPPAAAATTAIDEPPIPPEPGDMGQDVEEMEDPRTGETLPPPPVQEAPTQQITPGRQALDTWKNAWQGNMEVLPDGVSGDLDGASAALQTFVQENPEAAAQAAAELRGEFAELQSTEDGGLHPDRARMIAGEIEKLLGVTSTPPSTAGQGISGIIETTSPGGRSFKPGPIAPTATAPAQEQAQPVTDQKAPEGQGISGITSTSTPGGRPFKPGPLAPTVTAPPQAQAVTDQAVNEDVSPETDGDAATSKPEIIEHITKKGRAIRGIIRTDLTKDEAKEIDPYTFAKDGGFFIREKHLTPEERGETGQDAEVAKGAIGEQLASGDVRLTATGRQTTPFPRIDTGSDRKAGNTLKRVDRWLMDNAIAEAESRGDDFNLRQFQANRDKPSQADKDSAELYLFNEQQPDVPPSILKPLVDPTETTEQEPTETETATTEQTAPVAEDAAPPKSTLEQIQAMSDADLDALFEEIDREEEAAKSPPKTTPVRTPTTSTTATGTGTATTPQPRTAGTIAKEGGIGAIKAVQESIKGLSELLGAPNTLRSGLSFDEESYQKAKPHFISAWNGVKDVGYSAKELAQYYIKMFGDAIKPFVRRFMADLRDNNLDVQAQLPEDQQAPTDDRPTEETRTEEEESAEPPPDSTPPPAPEPDPETETITKDPEPPPAPGDKADKSAATMLIKAMAANDTVIALAQTATDLKAFQVAVDDEIVGIIEELITEATQGENFDAAEIAALESLKGNDTALQSVTSKVYQSITGKGKKDKEPDEFEGIAKPEDSGERMAGKRSARDHRLKELSEAISGEYTGNTASLLDAIIRKTSKPKNMPIALSEQATPGTRRYLEYIRKNIMGSFLERVGANYGGGRGKWNTSYRDTLIQALKGDDIRESIINEASQTIWSLEALEVATKDRTTVDGAGAALSELIFEPAARTRISEAIAAGERIMVSMADLTASGREIRNRSEMSVRGLVAMFYQETKVFAKDETEATDGSGKTRPIRRESTKIMDVPYSVNEYRDGQIVETGETLDDTFGFRGTEFGEWATGKERVKFINLMYDAMKDLAQVIGAPDKAVAIGRRLGMAFGSRGRGKWAAHYEPDTKVINMTKTRGDGSTAHEWGHAFSDMSGIPDVIKDFKNALSSKYNIEKAHAYVKNILSRKDRYSRSRTAKQDIETVRGFLKGGWKKSTTEDGIRENTTFREDALILDNFQETYWATPEEMWARSFETFIADSLGANVNPYLVDKKWVEPGNISKETGYRGSPYPRESERQYFNDIYRKLFDSLEWSEDGVPSLKPGYELVTTQIINEIQEEFDKLDAILEDMQKEFLQGEPSDDGLYWYAFRMTNRAPRMQPKGYLAYDDAYSIVNEEDNRGGTGAVGYSHPLDPESIRNFDLLAIKHEDSETTVRLEVTDDGAGDGEDGNVSTDNDERLADEEARDGQEPGERGPTGGPREPGGGSSSGPTNIDVGSGDGLPGREGDSDGGIRSDPDGGGLSGLENQPTLVGNYHLTDEDIEFISGANSVQRYTANISAIRTLKELESENRPPTIDEQSILARYTGWGGISDDKGRHTPLDRSYYDTPWNDRYDTLKELLTEEEFKSIKSTIVDAFYTPPGVVQRFYSALSRLGFDDGKILEPAAGVGNLFGMMPPTIKGRSSMVGVEIDSISARIAARLYPDASIFHSPFEKSALPEGHFDLVASNVPFSDRIRPADRKFNKGNFLLHDYFITKAIALARPGGLVAVITSQGSMNKKNSRARRQWANMADLVGAIRMPTSTFKDNTNTEVVTDLLIFRKKGKDLPEMASHPFVEAKSVTLKEKGYEYSTSEVSVNEYFLNNPEMVLGEQFADWRSSSTVVLKEGEDLLEKMDKAIERLPRNIYTRATTKASDIDPVDTIPLPDDAISGAFNIIDGKVFFIGPDGTLKQLPEGTPKEKKLATMARAMIQVRGSYWTLLRSILAKEQDTQAIKKARAFLNKNYDAFQKAHGEFSRKENLKEMGKDSYYGTLLALEVFDYDTQKLIRKADIFTKDTISRPVEPESFDNPMDALMFSMAKTGRVDIDLVASKTGKSPDEVLDLLRGEIFDDPENGWVPKDVYASGNVRDKFRVAQLAAATNPKYEGNVKFLESVVPKDIPPSDIRVDDPGAVWIDASDLARFAHSLIPGSRSFLILRNPVMALDDVKGDEWQFAWDAGSYHGAKQKAKDERKWAEESSEATRDWGTEHANFFKLFEHVLKGSRPQITEDGALLPDATRAALEKISLIKQRFEQWLWEDTRRADKYIRRYNERFNSYVRPQMDGKHLTLPGKVHDSIFQMRPNQLNAVWRSIVMGNTYFGHEVGVGKTATMVAAIMEHRRLGLAKKPLMVVLKPTVSQIQAEFLRLYPTARLLVAEMPTATAKNKARRKALANQIANNEYDAIIMTMEQAGRFALSPVAEAEYVQEEIDRLEAYMRQQVEGNLSDADRKNIEKAKRALKQKLASLLAVDDTEAIYFDDLGIDMMVVDEAHKFKNLSYKTKRGTVKGLSGDRDTKRSQIMHLKTWYLNKINPGRNVIFASGTPVSNSIDELFALQRYLQPELLERLGMANFDQWAANFATIGPDTQYKPEGGGYQVVTKVTGFKNLPELVNIAYQVLDVVTAKMAGILRPKMETGAPIKVVVSQGEAMKALTKHILDRVKRIRDLRGSATYGKRADGTPIIDNVLRILMLGRQGANDPRIVFPDSPDSDIGKAAVVSDRVLGYYKETTKDKGTQLVFANLGVPTTGRPFNMFDAIKQRLLDGGVKENEIAFARSFKTEDERRKMNSMVNSGQIRVLIGSTEDMGTGINVQKRVRAVHHLDIGWNYADYVQRTGRALRFGNIYSHKKENSLGIDYIAVLNYSTESSTDGFMWSTVSDKSKFVDQLLSGEVTIREMATVSDATISAEQMVASISNDPLIEEKFKLEEDLRTLRRQQIEHQSDQRRISAKVNSELPGRISATEKLLKTNGQEKALLEQVTGITINGVPYILKKDGGEIAKAVQKMIGTETAKAAMARHQNAIIGEIGITEEQEISETVPVLDKDGKPALDKEGKPLTRVEKRKERSFTWSRPAKVFATKSSIDGELKLVLVTIDGRKSLHALTGGVSRSITTQIGRLDTEIERGTDSIQKWNDELEKLRPQVGLQFPKGMELAQKSARMVEINSELTSRADDDFYTGPQYFVVRDGFGNPPVRVIGRALDIKEFNPGGSKTPSVFVFPLSDGGVGVAEYMSGKQFDEFVNISKEDLEKPEVLADITDKILEEYPDLQAYLTARTLWLDETGAPFVGDGILDIHLNEVQEDVVEEVIEDDDLSKASYAQNTDTSATHSAESLRKELRGKLGAARLSQLIDDGRVRIHDSAGAFKAATGRSATGTTGRLIQGMYVDGVVHLIAPHIKENEGFAVLRHELGVHAGRLMQTEEAFQRILDSIMARKDEVSETGTAIRKAIKRVPEGTKEHFKSEEVLSYLVEMAPEIGIARRFIALIKRMLVKMGFSRDMFTTADFVAMAESALRRDGGDGRVAGAPVGAMASVSQEMTDALKSWFGTSKVTDGGQPKIVYHGSPTFGKDENFTFDPNRADGKTKTPGRGLGTFFAADRTESVGYAAAGGTVEGVYLRVENPLVINSHQLPAFNSVEEAKAFRRRKQLQGHDGIHIKDEDHWVIFDANQAKSADKNTGAFSRADNDIRHSEAAEAFDKEDIPAAGKIIVKRHAKPDISAFWKHLSSPEWYMRKFRAAREILNTQLKRHEDKFTMENEILGDFVPFMEEMQKDDPTSYAEATDILLAKDKPGSKWFGIQPEAVWSATLDGKWVASAESVAKLDKIIQKEAVIEGRPLGDYKKAATDNWIVTRDNKPIKTYQTEKEAVEALIKAEDAQLQRDGVSDGARMIVRRFRAMTNTAFDKMIADLRRIQKEFRDLEINEPTVEIDRPWVLERDGKAIGSFNSEADATAAMNITYQVMLRKPGMTAKKIGQLNVRERTGKDARQPVSLSQLIADMNSLRGTYFPRQRPPGGVIMRAYKEDKKLLEKFDFYMIGKDHVDPVTGEVLRSRPSKIIEKMTQGINAASGYLPFIPTLEKRARELRNQGYTVVIERDDSMPETIFEVAKLTSSMDALLRGAAAKLKGEEGQRAVVEETKKMLTAYVADIIKQRGYLASRMTRTDEYWEGFETDPLLAGTQYARGIASGLAKREAAQKMFAFFTGRDVTWKQWKDANPDGKWKEYDAFVEERRIDPKQQPALYKETLEFIEDALRNEEQTDRVISTLKGLAVVKFLGFRVSSALVNLTNMVMAVPASISAGSKGGIGNAFKAIGNAAVQYAQYRRANGKMSVEDRKVFMEITNRGWDAAQFNQENATVLMSKAGRGYAKFVEYSMLMFGEVERINRATTIFAAYKELRRNTALDEDAALQQAKEISDNAHGIYTKTTVPPWVRNMPAAKLIYTFQKFMHNYTLNMVDMGMKGQNKELAYMLLSPILLGGIQGSLATTAILAIASGLGSDVPEEDFYNWAEETFGSDTFFRQGLPAALFGISLKGSIQINNPMPRNLAEVAGAPGSVVMDIYKGLGHIKDGEFAKGGEALLPTAFGGLIKAVREGSEGLSTGTYGHVFYGDEPLRATTTDQITRALSFNPARISGIREKQWNEKREAEAFRERREKVNTQIKRYYLFGKGDYQELAKEIQRYNELAIGTGRVDIPRITGRSIRTMLKRAQRPSKIERQRAATMQN